MAATERPTGIVGYGAYIPRFRIAAREIAQLWTGGDSGPVDQKSVAGPDEDTITMTVEAGRSALRRAGIAATALGTVWVGWSHTPTP